MQQVTVSLSTTEEHRERISPDFERALGVLYVIPENGVRFEEGHSGHLKISQQAYPQRPQDLSELAANLQRAMPDYRIGLSGMPEAPVVELIHQGQ